MKGRLLLIDGQSFCYRAFYAIRELTNSKGEPTNAIYGFITMLRKLLREEAPDYAAICFDRKEPTFRLKRYEAYKAHRKPMPDDLIEQMPHIKEFIHACRIPIFEQPGYEADDLLGTIAKKGEAEGLEVLIVTGDKDALQLVDDRVKILNTYKEEILDRKHVKERFGGLGPERVVDVMSLAGDQSDNIPGVPGIGEKTAVELICEHGSLEGVYQHLDRVKGIARKKALEENKQVAYLSKDLATIDCHVPIETDFAKMKMQPPDEARLAELFKHFEFRSLLKELTPSGEAGEEKRKYKIISTAADLEKLIKQLEKANAIAVDTETTSTEPMQADLVGMSLSVKFQEAYYIPVSLPHHQGQGLDWGKVKKRVAPVLEDERIAKYGQNIKYDFIVLKRHGIELRGTFFDTMIASYLVNPLKLNHNLDDIAFEYLGVKKIDIASLIGTGKKQISMAEVPLEKISEYAAEDADCVFRLVEPLQKLLGVHRLNELFEKVEIPLLGVLAQIEMNGVAIDQKFLAELSRRLGEDLDRLTSEIYREAGAEFNINSTKQLSDILFTKLKLPIIKRTKTGYSTDADVLERLAQSYELPKRLLEYREKSKLKSTYVDALPELIHPETHVIHASFNQTTTATGRLSSSDPNLQNIPIKTEIGRQIRRAFIPRAKERKILSADYSQVELRVLAHFSGDPNLTQAFKEDRDIHQFTATLLYNVSPKDVTREMRNVAKTINFSIVYGVSAFGLAQSLSTSVSEAQAFIDSYFLRYAKVKEYMEAQKELARQHGFLTTILGRRSYFPDIHSHNPNRRQFAERAAINAPIQGSAADIIKLAMIQIQNELQQKNFTSLMILQVHDELVFDAAESELDKLQSLVRTKMENAYPLEVPLRADVTVGDSWFKA
ncbi:MAG: DNA polymerase I [Candidatus Omnitrophica bacterium]|nr:DNA polymerase I [Candidatus Omnitrophota bacterium]